MSKAPKPDDVRAGENLRITRMRLGVSQEKLAERVGLTFQQIQKYEKGTNRMGVSRLAEIARALGVNFSVLLDGIEGGDRVSIAPRTVGLAERLESLPPTDRRIVDAMVDRMEAA